MRTLLQIVNIAYPKYSEEEALLQIEVNIAYPKYSVSEEEDSFTNSEHSLSKILRVRGRGLFYKLK